MTSATTARTPSAASSGAHAASSGAMSSARGHGGYARAAPGGETGSPRARSRARAAPLTAAPPTMGLTPTTDARVAPRASATPGTARIEPTEVTGLEGQTTTRSASRIASSTPGAGRARSAPSYSTPTTSTWHLSRTKYSWKPSRPSGVRIVVRTASSLIGRILDATPSAWARSAVTAESVRPSCSARVRTTYSVLYGFAQRPEGAAAAPRVEADADAAGERSGERHLGHRDEAEAHPDAVETERPREDGGGAERARVVERRRHQLRGDLERIVGTLVGAHDGPVQQDVAPVLLAGERADEALAARARRVGAPRQRGRRRRPGHGGEVEQRAGRRGVGQGPVTDALPDPRERGRGERRRRGAPGLGRRSGEVRCRAAGPTSSQAPRPSRSSRDGTCTRASRGS